MAVPAQDAGADLASYELSGRRVGVQHLNLSPPQRVALRDFLEWNARPENAGYRYDYYLDNCSSRVRDALDQALEGLLAGASVGQPARTTFRRETQRLTAPVPWFYLGTHAGLGPTTDQPIDRWQAAFVPMTLQEIVRDIATADDDGRSIPLVAREERLQEATLPDPGAEPPAWRWRFAATARGTVIVLVTTSRNYSPQRCNSRPIVWNANDRRSIIALKNCRSNSANSCKRRMRRERGSTRWPNS